MNIKSFSWSALALATVAVCVPAFAADEATTHDGTLVSIASNTLTMSSKTGTAANQHTHALTADAKLTLDGKPCKAEDLKPGTRIRVSTQAGNAKIATNVEAIQQNALFGNTHEGKVVSITEKNLVMTNKSGNEHTHTLAANAKIKCDGKVCKASDLKPGMSIRVRTATADQASVVEIEALNKDVDFAYSRHDGKVVSITGGKLVMSGPQGSEEHTCNVASDVRVTCDGKVCKSTDLKAGMKIRVTTESNEGSREATRIEAIEKNPEFAGL